ncbi:MAG TPA: glycosyltransferase family 4 protein [Nitrospiraceae bacterium]|nr:glycosyltransferase family 4 protein [Nitrospiraceae bacterium]
MRVLLAHNFYRSGAPSGEDSVYHHEKALLSNNGIDVVPYEMFNDNIDIATFTQRARLALDTAWSHDSYNAVSRLIEQCKPDIAHFHNTFPQISPSAYAACQDKGVPVVQTLHNFRLICPGGLLMRDGRPCEDCVGTSLIPAMRHRCYRSSLPATGAVVWMLLRNRWQGTYQTLVDRYIALTEFAANRMIVGGFPRERISVKPHSVTGVSAPGMGDGGYVVYVGRLTQEKGVRTLLRAWTHLREVPLRIIGDGALKHELEDIAKHDDLPVEFLGLRSQSDVYEYVRRAACIVVPSECYETFGMAVVEAYACGTPVIASRIGSLNEIVEEGVTGVKFDPCNSQDLAAKIHMLWDNAERRTRMRETARTTYENKYSPEKNFRGLLSIYEQTIRSCAQISR